MTSRSITTAAALGAAAVLLGGPARAGEPLKAILIEGTARVELIEGSRRATVAPGERYGRYTVMAVLPDERTAILEDFTTRDGKILFVGERGVSLELSKTSEPTFATQPPYLGHTLAEVKASGRDLLAETLLRRPGDPRYTDVAAALPPITRVRANVYSFLGTPDSRDKVWVNYGGRTSNFDPAVYQPSIRAVRDAGKVWDGLVGGYLPALRFVYPEGEGTWTEMVAYAPFRTLADERVQPVWYRVARVEGGELRWARHVDTYLPYPPRGDAAAAPFYADLAQLKQTWDAALAPGMRIEVPDAHLANLARFSLLRTMATRVQGFPKYGAVETNYGGAEHDGFPDTFTVEVAAFLEWGLVDRAGAIIDNYFSKFVRDDGSIVYRGPETGQFGRMLTVLAQYANAGGDPELLRRQRARIDALTRVLLAMREQARRLPAADPAYGLISGWSEADSVLDLDPQRYFQPYFSNTTEAARGFRDLGRVWQRLGFTEWGTKLVGEAAAMRRDLETAYGRSTLDDGGMPVLPAIAGVEQPFHVAVARDRLDPQHRSYRTYMEMMYSGSLMREQVAAIVDYRARHHDTLLGMPTAYGYETGEVAGFLSYGHGYGLIQHDFIREALLLTYSVAAHQYTRGTWLAPETRQVIADDEAAPYCTPAQLVVPLFTKWLLVFEDPERETLWLAKGAPREWLADGRRVAVSNAATRWGRVGFTIDSRAARRFIDARVTLPEGGIAAELKLRLRAVDQAPMKSVTVNGRRWTAFDAAGESVTIPANTAGPLMIVARY